MPALATPLHCKSCCKVAARPISLFPFPTPAQATVESLQASLDEKTTQLEGVQQSLEAASAAGEAAQQRLQQRVAELEAQLADSAAAAQAAEARLAGLQQQLSELADSAAAKEAELAGEWPWAGWSDCAILYAALRRSAPRLPSLPFN